MEFSKHLFFFIQIPCHERGHGRYEIRDYTVVEIDTEISPFPHVAQIIKETRIYRSVEEGAEPKISERIFGMSHRPGEKA